MSEKYTPNYPDPSVETDVPNLSGLSPRQNVAIEEAAQRRVAEDPVWHLAKEINGAYRGQYGVTSREGLEERGFEIIGEDGLFYTVHAPEGWTKETSGFWTTVKDELGEERISQFYKGAWYDTRAFLNFQDERKRKSKGEDEEE